jgi:phage anti-repressor protein
MNINISFKDFLKNNTTINNKFLDDFNFLINDDYMEHYYDFLVDSNKLINWLDISKEEFKKTIYKSYKINVDYIIEKNENKKIGSGGHNEKIILLTPEACKKICLMTKSKIGEKVRQYFIDVELAIYKYKKHIINSLNEKVNKLENNQKPKIKYSKGIIYVFRALNEENATLYKIGKTINSKKRFNSHNSPLSNDIEIVLVYEADNIEQLEKCIKTYMQKAQYRKYKEIYRVNLDIIKNVIKVCDTKIKEINEIIDFKNNLKRNNYLKKITNDDKLYMLIPQL